MGARQQRRYAERLAKKAKPKGHPGGATRGKTPIDPRDVIKHAQNQRHLRGLQIAATETITYQGGDVFTVTSQTAGDRIYKVEVGADGTVSCSCPDWKKRRLIWCKHGFAVVESRNRYTPEERATWKPGFVLPRLAVSAGVLDPRDEKVVQMYDGARRRPKVVIDFPTGPRETTRRNKAYATMRVRVPQLLSDLCRRYVKNDKPAAGGQPMPHHERLYSVLYRTFANRSLHDTIAELKFLARRRRYIANVPCKNSLCSYVHDASLTADLRNMLRRIAGKVRDIETMVLVDSTGISSFITQDYLDTNRGRKVVREGNRWFKAHVASGGVTGVVVEVIITSHSRYGENDDPTEPTADVNYWTPLVTAAASIWRNLLYALGDKGYLSEKNIQDAHDLGIRAMIPIKRKWNPANKTVPARELYEIYTQAIEVFEEIYRYRSNIEGVFSAVKRVCGHYLWSRGSKWPYGPPTLAQHLRARAAFENEILAKFIILSLRRLVVLEQLHDEEVNFSNNESLKPLPPEWFKTEDMDDLALVAEIEESPDDAGNGEIEDGEIEDGNIGDVA